MLPFNMMLLLLKWYLQSQCCVLQVHNRRDFPSNQVLQTVAPQHLLLWWCSPWAGTLSAGHTLCHRSLWQSLCTPNPAAWQTETVKCYKQSCIIMLVIHSMKYTYMHVSMIWTFTIIILSSLSNYTHSSLYICNRIITPYEYGRIRETLVGLVIWKEDDLDFLACLL